MANKTGKSYPNGWGGYDHYDSNGKKTGYSMPSAWGGYDTYDSHGHKTGYTMPDGFGGYDSFDAHGHKTGHSSPGMAGYYHYDKNNKQIGSSTDTGFGYSHDDSTTGGCYVATCVYGSYDCPEVWTLRRFRDLKLAETWYGRAFIHCYYTCSPTIVKWFGKTAWFQKFWRGKLDRMVAQLQQEGFESTPYQDRNW